MQNINVLNATVHLEMAEMVNFTFMYFTVIKKMIEK